ncbi:hypothetical protein [Pseudonocardia sp. NPDC046786]|uniref:hypothetical protein n=1 Tax=Pseudonocardia sp. NPDC046786 TaxID=3155471 RepID=UPI0033C4009B
MSIHDFTLVIDGALDDDELDALYEAGFDDSTPEVESDRTLLHISRDAPSLPVAIASALRALDRAGLPVSGVGSPDLVELPVIAERVGRSRESIRLLAAGRRGPGGFPAAREGLYSWAAVREWFAHYAPATVGSPPAEELHQERVIAAADHLVQARNLMRGHAEELRELLPS